MCLWEVSWVAPFYTTFADNRSTSLVIDKNKKAQKPREPTEKLQETKNSEQFQFLIFRDSITKNISLSARANCDEIQAVNYSTGGLKARGVCKQLRVFKKDHCNACVKSIVIHVGANHLSRDNLVDVVNKIYRLMIHISTKFPNTLIYFLAIVTKFDRSFNSTICILIIKKWNLYSTVTLQSAMILIVTSFGKTKYMQMTLFFDNQPTTLFHTSG